MKRDDGFLGPIFFTEKWEQRRIVCKEDSPEHHAFNWRIWNETILDASKDMCQRRERPSDSAGFPATCYIYIHIHARIFLYLLTVMSENSTVVLNEQDLEVSHFADPTPKFHNFDASIAPDFSVHRTVG